MAQDENVRDRLEVPPSGCLFNGQPQSVEHLGDTRNNLPEAISGYYGELRLKTQRFRSLNKDEFASNPTESVKGTIDLDFSTEHHTDPVNQVQKVK